ncbi:ATP-binding protein [Actinoallomurus acaciae]|uniref:ATP-binding protein n=1 Tax=Actinoallomurus acaciae TaxID=502577 RepID=A0ABV5YSF0_9ACTN
MTANHRVRAAGRRPAAQESIPMSSARPTDDSRGRDAVIDWRISVPGVPAIVAVARRLVRAALEHSPRCDDIELVTSELMTNAIRHTPSGKAGSLVTLRIRGRRGWARIEVADLGSPSWAEPGPAAVEDERGRGLGIIQMLADRSGREPENDGQVSWAEIHWDVPSDAGPTRFNAVDRK